MAYAARTSVPVSQSKADIEAVLRKYGASEFMYYTKPECVLVAFKNKNRLIKITVPMPSPKTFKTPDAYAQEERRLWRALLLMIRSKLECVASGITSFEDEFLPYTVMGNGQTVADWARPQLNQLAEAGRMPPLLLSPTVQTFEGEVQP